MKRKNSTSSKDTTSSHPKALHKEKYLCVAKEALKNLIYSKTISLTAREILSQIASLLLKGYSIQEVFSKNTISEHARGSIHIYNLSNPMKIFWLAVMPEKMLSDNFFPQQKLQEKEWIQLWAELGNLQNFAEQYTLCNIDRYIEAKASENYLETLLILVSHNFHTLPHCTLNLYKQPGIFTDALVSLYSQMDKENKRGFLPAVLIPLAKESFEKEKEKTLEKICHLALITHKVSFQNHREEVPEMHPWSLGSICLNLVQAAYKAGEGNLNVFWQEVRESFSFAVRAHLDQKRFMLNLIKDGYMNFLADSPWNKIYKESNAVFFVEICGLAESTLFLSKQTMAEEEGWEIAVQTLAYLCELARSSSAKHGINLILCDLDRDEKTAHRFLKLDKKHFPSYSNNFSEYTKGPRMNALTNLNLKERIQKEGELHRYIPSRIFLMPDIPKEDLPSLLQYAYEETHAFEISIV